MKAARKVWGLIFLYAAVFGALDLLRHFSYTQNSNDVAAFDQSLWWFLRGRGFYNSIEGMSHFGVHFSPVLFLLLPFYALFPSPVTLIVLQCFACALGIGLVYLIGRKILNKEGGLSFALLFSLYHPLQGVSWDIVNELCFVIAPLLLAYYGYLKNRPPLLWAGCGLAVLCKEEIGLTAAFFGLFLIAGSLFRKEKRWKIHGALLFAVGLAWTFLSLDAVIPHFRHGPYQYFSSENRYADFGNSLGTIVRQAAIHPGRTLAAAFTLPKILYVLELLLPLGFVSLKAPAALFMAVPTLAANLLSNSPMMSMTGARYPAAAIPFLFISAVYGTKRLAASSSNPAQTQRKIFRLQLVLTILCTLLLSSTPLRFPFRHMPRITRHDAAVRSLLRDIPAGSAVSTQPDFTAHVAHGCAVSPFFRPGSRYVLLDPSFAQWYRDSRMSPQEIRSKGYALVRSEDGALLFQREPFSQGRSNQPFP